MLYATPHAWALSLVPASQLHSLLAEARNKSATASVLQQPPVAEQPNSGDSDRPNILMVLTDDHGYTDLTTAIDSNVATPWLGELVRNGAHFVNGYASASQCVPSRAGLLTGRNQNSFGLWANGVDAGFGPNTLPPRPNVTTIAEHLKGQGYVTAMAGKWHLGSLDDPNRNPGGRGFDWYFAGTTNQWYANVWTNGSYRGSLAHTPDKRNRIDVTGEMVEAFLDRHGANDNPWFFFWAPYGPHHPMLEDGDHYLETYTPKFTPLPMYTAEENDARRRGLALVHAIDTRMGGIMVKLRSQGLEDKTLILFSSDNGAPNGLSYESNDFHREIWRDSAQPSPDPLPIGSSPPASATRCRAVIGQPEYEGRALGKDVVGPVDDAYCVQNCGNTPPNCPPDLCTCDGSSVSSAPLTPPSSASEPSTASALPTPLSSDDGNGATGDGESLPRDGEVVSETQAPLPWWLHGGYDDPAEEKRAAEVRRAVGAEDYLRFVRDPSSSYVGSENVPLRGGKGTTWEGGIKVPMFAYWKGKIAPGQVFNQPVTTLDLTATIAHAAGMNERPAKDFDGVSLLPNLLTNPAAAEFSSHQYWIGLLGDASVQHDGWKLRRSHETFLFNVSHDPYEMYNLMQSHKSGGPKMAAMLNAELDRWLSTLPFSNPCGPGCLAGDSKEALRGPKAEPCTKDEVDPRFVPSYGDQRGHATCWPTPITEVRN